MSSPRPYQCPHKICVWRFLCVMLQQVYWNAMRRQGLVLTTALLSISALMPFSIMLSKEPQRYRSTSIIALATRPIPGSQLEILNSRILAQAVFEKLPKATREELFETSYRLDYWNRLGEAFLRIRRIEQDDGSARRAVGELRGRMTFVRFASSDLITISADASRPEAAMDIVNTYLEVLKEKALSTFPILFHEVEMTMKLIDPPSPPMRAANPKRLLAVSFVVLALAPGLSVAVAATVERAGRNPRSQNARPC